MTVEAGGGGFIGGHLVADLVRKGYTRIRAIDIKPVDDHLFPEAESLQLDLREKPACYQAVNDARFVLNLAADIGGMGFIETHRADCMLSVPAPFPGRHHKWAPSTPLLEGMQKSHSWIHEEMHKCSGERRRAYR
jgi:hypothetical protein